MPIQIACPKCNAKYQVSSKFQGKVVKCQKCNTSFKVAAQSAAAQNKTESNIPAQEYHKLGIDGPITSRAPDLFDSPPPQGHAANMLGNHAMDPGFSAAPPKPQADVEPQVSDLFTNPALDQQKPKKKSQVLIDPKKPRKKKGSSKKKKKLTQQVWFLLLITLLPLTLLCTIPIMFLGSGWSMLAAIPFGFSIIAGMAVGIWGLILAHEATGDVTTIILCLLVPFFMLYIIIVHWRVMQHYVYATLIITFCQVFSMLGLGILDKL